MRTVFSRISDPVENPNLVLPGLLFIPNKFLTGGGSLRCDPFRFSTRGPPRVKTGQYPKGWCWPK